MTYAQSATSWQFETYGEMGAAVPFTSPELTGARARISARGLELTLPNPAGKRGVYVLDPREVKALCVPSLHDQQLVHALTALPAITPAEMRRVARAVAAAGFAGRPAAAASRRAEQQDRRAWAEAQSEILRSLVARGSTATPDPATLDQAAQAALAELTAQTGHAIPALVAAIAAAAHLAAACGPPVCLTARYPASLAELDALGRAVSQEAPAPSRAELGRAAHAATLLLSAARDTIILARRALNEARRCLEDIRAALGNVTALCTAIGQHTERLDWLLDGWAPICQVWCLAAPSRVCATLNEIGLLVPSIPAEASTWFGLAIQEAPRQSLREAVLGSADWRSCGLVHDLLVRNEAIRALAS